MATFQGVWSSAAPKFIQLAGSSRGLWSTSRAEQSHPSQSTDQPSSPPAMKQAAPSPHSSASLLRQRTSEQGNVGQGQGQRPKPGPGPSQSETPRRESLSRWGGGERRGRPLFPQHPQKRGQAKSRGLRVSFYIILISYSKICSL